MVRFGKLRSFITEFAESPLIEKLSFLLPFLVIIIDIILIEHAIRINEHYIIILTSGLCILSVIEIAVVLTEIHAHVKENSFERMLTIKLDDFIMKGNYRNVKRIVENFIERHTEYHNFRIKIYHLACQILETQKQESMDNELDQRLTQFIHRRKKMTVNDLLVTFLTKYPKYKKFRAEIYRKICEILNVEQSK